MIIDQHRADVRIRYEHILRRLSEKTVSTQRLLFPEMVQFSPSETVLMQRFLPDLLGMGFDISDLGGGSFAVSGLPADVAGQDPVSLVRNIVTDASEQGMSANPETLHTSLALSMARNTAIDYGQVLSNEEMELLVDRLFACSNANYTPDGHTILSILPQAELDRLLP